VKTVLGVDCSTQSCTIVERELYSGEVISIHRSPHPRTTPPISEQNPDSWWNAFKDCLSQIDQKRVAGISVAGQGHGLVVLNSQDKVIRPAKLWNDTTSTSQSEELISELGIAAWQRKCGSVPLAAFTITKLAWLRKNEPENFASVQKIMNPHDYINYQLTGKPTTDRSDASGTGYFDLNRNSWDESLLKLVDKEKDWISCLPRVLMPDETAGFVSEKVVTELGFSSETIVGSGSNDNQGSALAYGVVDPGDFMISIGTSGTAFTPSQIQVGDPEGLISCMAHTVSGYLPLICTLNGTKVTDLFAKLFGRSLSELGELALMGENSSTRPVLRPWIDGERTPSRTDSRAILSNLDNSLEIADIARSAFEGVIFGIYFGVEKLISAGLEPQRLIVTGGGSKSKAYLQFISDLTGKPVFTVDFDDAAASGAAIQASAAVQNIGLRSLVQEWKPVLKIAAEPRDDQNTREVYESFKILMSAE
jgi:xylulokinase